MTKISGRTTAGWLFALALAITFSTGCVTKKPTPTQGEAGRKLEFGYVPFDPLPVGLNPAASTRDDILKALPDETMRMATAEITGSGGITYGPAKIGYEGRQYVVTIDYIKFNTKSLALMHDPAAGLKFAGPGTKPEYTVPVYVGVGLRLTAEITVNKGSVDLGSLFALGLEAKAGKISGTLTIQSLGLTGEGVTSAIPIPTKIDDSTIQNAIVALGSIKGKMYSPATVVSPRVVGIYKNFDSKTGSVNDVIGLLLSNPVTLNTAVGAPSPL